MARIAQEIVVKREQRACFVKMADGHEVKAIWHMFGTRAYPHTSYLISDTSGQVSYPIAVVEFEDGTIHEISATEMRFADGGEFEEIEFREG